MSGLCEGMTNWQRCRFHHELREKGLKRYSPATIALAKTWRNTLRRKSLTNTIAEVLEQATKDNTL